MIVLNTRDGKSRPALITVNRNQNFLMSEMILFFSKERSNAGVTFQRHYKHLFSYLIQRAIKE